MPKPLAIQGVLVDAKNVAAHRCVRLSIDVPAELGASIVEAFGWPTMAEPVYVAVARLVPVVEAAAPAKTKQRWVELPLSQQAAIRCGEAAFRRYLREALHYDCDSAAEAAVIVRYHAAVKSRADIKPGTEAGQLWTDFESNYQAWLKQHDQHHGPD